MANTFVPIAKAALTGTQQYIDFNSIPTTYNDLYLIGSARCNTGTSQSIYLSINYGTTGYSSQTFKAFETDGSSVTINTFANQGAIPGSSSSNSYLFNSFECYIPNYQSSSNKVFHTYTVSTNNSTTLTTALRMTTGNLNDNNVINSIRIVASGASFVANTRFDLYGIKNT